MRNRIVIPLLLAVLAIPLAYATPDGVTDGVTYDTPPTPVVVVEQPSTASAVMGWFADKGAYVMKKGKAGAAAMANDDPYHHQLDINKKLVTAQFEYKRRISELETQLAVTRKMEPHPDEYIVQEAAAFCAKVLEDAYAIRRAE